MKSIKVGKKWIGEKHPCFIIAEIGQNHQGNVDIAKEMILSAKNIGVDCVKFQKSCLVEKFTKSALERPYISANSFGLTYGSHKEHLEFSDEIFRDLQIYAKKIGILFTASAHDHFSFEQLIEIGCPFIKIGSGDANNYPLLRKASKRNIPLIISTGMQTIETIKKIDEIMKLSKFQEYSLMHCVSSYPTNPQDTNLRLIEKYQELFPNVIIGYSGHEQGIEITQAAVILGAKIIERHFTLNKLQKGSDHNSSLIPSEFEKLIKKIRTIEKMMPKSKETNFIIETIQLHNDLNEQKIEEIKESLGEPCERQLMDCEKVCYDKLGKSLVYSRNMEKGHILTNFDILIKVAEPKGIKPELYDEIVGKSIVKNVSEDLPILETDFDVNFELL